MFCNNNDFSLLVPHFRSYFLVMLQWHKNEQKREVTLCLRLHFVGDILRFYAFVGDRLRQNPE